MAGQLNEKTHIEIDKSGNVNFQLLNSTGFLQNNKQKKSCYKHNLKPSDYIEQALKVKSVDELFFLTNKIACDYGFSIAGGGLGYKSTSVEINFNYFCLTDYKEWSKHYVNNVINNDPLLYYLQNNFLPVVVKMEEDFSCAQRMNRIPVETLMDFGISGIATFPTPSINTSMSGFRFAYTKNDALTSPDVDHYLPLFSLMSTYLHEAMIRIMAADKKFKKIQLSRREKEILSWVASGLTTWKISEKLNISENTVLTHMKNVHNKLGVKSRQHAVAKAMSMNLI